MTTLKRTLTLPQLVLYGMGTTIGAGIYALVGEIAGIAGHLAPAAFLLAALLATITALSFAELSSRYPQTAGAALYSEKAFGLPRLSRIIGLLVSLAGIASAAALINGFVGYLQVYLNLDRSLLIIIITLMTGGLAIWGIAESVTVAALITLVEIGGLLLIIGVSQEAFSSLPEQWPALLPAADTASLAAISGGAILAFYAFIGFEDMVEVAEEVEDVKRTMPLGILLTISITTVIYLLIMLAAVLALPPASLAASSTPLTLLYENRGGQHTDLLNMIGMVAVVNGAIIQMIMASRVLYGLGKRGQLPSILASIHPRTRTPAVATLLIMLLVLLLALTGRLVSLAEATSLIVLITYATANLSLWRIKQHTPRLDGAFYVPALLPLLGFVCCTGFVVLQLLELF